MNNVWGQSDPASVDIDTCNDFEEQCEHKVDCDDVTNNQIYGIDELASIESTYGVFIPNAHRLQETKQEAIVAMAPASEGQLPCFVCELDYVTSVILDKELTDNLIHILLLHENNEWVSCLVKPESIPASIVAPYNTSFLDSRLKGLLIGYVIRFVGC
ncbi:hypothetical protein JG688_00016959 [Phytophthora aleatoria]|uniref:Uncharacterized protein n=1 Tax=Phytophthora aleatoria TaxID=2496075 RepID=A0A8J5IBC2_9STRA|nr:hypothetical protein JG688_00016959 [Phytophthora aleatoria]